jgi:hypothetical protein
MEANRRMRVGALLGAIAGPPILILGTNPLIQPYMAASAKVGVFPWWVLAVLACGVSGIVGLPLLGASIATGGWIGRKPGRRLANHCIGGGFAGGFLAIVVLAVLGRMAHGFAVGGGGIVLRLLIAEAGLIGGVLLCFRSGNDPPPA